MTALLKPGQSATLTVTLKKRGKYEYLCLVPGHAAAGMKGLLGIRVKVTAAVSATASTSGQDCDLDEEGLGRSDGDGCLVALRVLPSLMRRATRRAWFAAFGMGIGVIVCVGATMATLPQRSAAGGAPFSWFVPAPAPAGWKHLTLALPSGSAVLLYPPSMHVIRSDSGSVSAAQGRSGNYLAYLNATPQQGDEQLSTWPAFRVSRLRDENGEPVHVDARAFGLSFRGGKGSCVIDDYFTRKKRRRFREIACFVKGRGAGSVIVAAAPPAEWGRVGPELKRAVADYEATS